MLRSASASFVGGVGWTIACMADRYGQPWDAVLCWCEAGGLGWVAPTTSAPSVTPTTSAPGLGVTLPHLHRDWAHP